MIKITGGGNCRKKKKKRGGSVQEPKNGVWKIKKKRNEGNIKENGPDAMGCGRKKGAEKNGKKKGELFVVSRDRTTTQTGRGEKIDREKTYPARMARKRRGGSTKGGESHVPVSKNNLRST